MASNFMKNCLVRTALAATLLVSASWALAEPRQGFLKLYKAKENVATIVNSGQDVMVWQFTPQEGTGPFPGILVLYGLDCLDELPKSELMYKNIAGKVADKGFVVQLVHYFNCTPFTPDEIIELKKNLLAQVPNLKDKPLQPKLEKYYRQWMETAKDGLEYLSKQPMVDKDRVGIIGLSMGGFLGTSLVVEYPDLHVGAVVNVFGGLPPQHHAKVRKLKMKLPPMLIMAAEDDDIVPEAVQRDLFQLLRDTGNRGEAHFYGDTGHGFYDKGRKAIDLNMAMGEALPTAIRFLTKHLQKAK